ncbi:hypothetical protein LZ31DRAFT_557973 [Colletotrichum somersetense]|nr:hypothetical protein LZ31DRAFT_557973 [Colletotrichum somersetense]
MSTDSPFRFAPQKWNTRSAIFLFLCFCWCLKDAKMVWIIASLADPRIANAS